MSIEVTDLAELDVTEVQQALEYLATLLQEDNPDVNTRFGVLHNLVLYPAAQFRVADRTLADRILRSNSLQAIAEDPTLADNDIVDKVLRNRGLVRIQGSNATGTLTIVVSELSPVTIANGAGFVGNGKRFLSTDAFTARTSSVSVASDSDRVLTAVGDGTYSFTIDVEAADPGTESMLLVDTLLEPENPIVNLVKIYATADFIGGVSTESNSSLLAREQEGIAAKALGNRVNMIAMLREHADYGTFVASSIIGYGDGEMVRYHSIFPIAFGGRTDWYIRTQELPQSKPITKTATLIEKTLDGKGIWQFTFTRDEAAGLYFIDSIVPTALENFTGTFAITEQIRGYDKTQILSELLPDINSSVEAAYSRFQTITVRFKDTETATAALTVNTSTADYDVYVRIMPNIAGIQSLVSSRNLRNRAGDILVKAPIPCMLSVSFNLQLKPGSVLPDAYAIQDAVALYVNRVAFTGRLYASAISDIVYGYLTTGVNCGAIDLFGQILRPDGTVKTIRSTDVLVVPDEPGNMVSARTVAFILDPTKVYISAEVVNIPENL